MEGFDELQLPAALELEALQLRERTIEVEHRVTLLDELALDLGRRQDHCLVRPIYLELDRHAALNSVPAPLSAGVVLRVDVVHGHTRVQDRAWVAHGDLLARPRVEDDVLGKRPGQGRPNPVRVQLQGLADPLH